MSERIWTDRLPSGTGAWRSSTCPQAPISRSVDDTLHLALVFNGTIYNYRELRAELISMGHTFVSEGDSEVIIKAYAAWGQQCVERFYGMFAFAIWDTRYGRQTSLFLARDRFGIKPLYLTQDGNRLRFASSLPALLTSGGVDTRLDPVALHHHFMLHTVVPPPRTILAGVRKLAPASTMTVRSAGARASDQTGPAHDTRPRRARAPVPQGDSITSAPLGAMKRKVSAARCGLASTALNDSNER